jgi:hypothetical protein
MDVFLSDDVLAEIMAAPGFSFDWHSRTIIGTVGHRRLARMILGLGPALTPLITRLVRSAAVG